MHRLARGPHLLISSSEESTWSEVSDYKDLSFGSETSPLCRWQAGSANQFIFWSLAEHADTEYRGTLTCTTYVHLSQDRSVQTCNEFEHIVAFPLEFAGVVEEDEAFTKEDTVREGQRSSSSVVAIHI